MTRVFPALKRMKGSRDRAMLAKASRQIEVSPRARRLLFNNLVSFLF
jgi:hypothetical protein